MELFTFFISILILFFALAVFANKFRRTHKLTFSLKPNCLLTRWPVVFVTGPRSLFYFSHYWNIYPVYLAEHGYEVFKVHLPWHDPAARRQRFKNILAEYKNKKFHFIVDAATALEMQELLFNHPAVLSVTEVVDAGKKPVIDNFKFRPLELVAQGNAGPLLRFSYFLHGKLSKSRPLPSLHTLGAIPATALGNAGLLLNRMQELAEEDYQEEASL